MIRAGHTIVPLRTLEDGNKDGRIVPVAVCMWACLLAVVYCGTQFERIPLQCAEAGALCWLGTIIWLIARVLSQHYQYTTSLMLVLVARLRQMCGTILWYGIILCAVTCGAAWIGTIHTLHTVHDPGMRITRNGSQQVTLVMHTSGIRASWRHNFDCMMTSRAVSIAYTYGDTVNSGVHGGNNISPFNMDQHLAHQQLVEPSHTRVVVFAKGRLCSAPLGQTVLVTGRLRAPAVGSPLLWRQNPWFEVQQSAVHILAEPKFFERAQQQIWNAFIMQTRLFDTQSAVLIPGLTMGLLGDDAYLMGSDEDTSQAQLLDVNHAHMIRRLTTDAGIVHLMAVSGGHVAIVMALVHWCVKRLRCSRLGIWMCVLTALMLLRWVMVPATSLDRALMMTAIGATAGVQGKPHNAISALGWTIVSMLTVDPALSCDIGFALSCAATAAIIAWAPVLTQWFQYVMPKGLAQALALTVSAQCGITPISVLIQPSIPWVAPLANILVTPCVGVVTLSGLVALLAAWCLPWLAHISLYVAAAGCDIIVHAAKLAVSVPIPSLPWSNSIDAAVSLAILLWILLLIVRISRLWWRRCHPERYARVQLTPWQYCAIWWNDTMRMMKMH